MTASLTVPKQYVSEKKDRAFALKAPFEDAYELLATRPDADSAAGARDRIIDFLNALEDAAGVACGFWDDLAAFVRQVFAGDFENAYVPLLRAYGEIRRMCAGCQVTMIPPPENFLEQWQRLLSLAVPGCVPAYSLLTEELHLPRRGFDLSDCASSVMQESAVVEQVMPAKKTKQGNSSAKSKGPPKARPRVFVGSSVEGLPVAQAIQGNMDHDFEVVIWSQGVFAASDGTLERLIEEAKNYDFAVLVLSRDDLTTSRRKRSASPRDNVIFELGIFMGSLGRERVFFVHDRTQPPKLPTDLMGVTAAKYAPHSSGNFRSALGAACTELMEAMKRLGVRKVAQTGQ